MVAASFVTLFYWLTFAGAVIYLLVLVERHKQRRRRVRRTLRLIERSEARERWDDRSAA